MIKQYDITDYIKDDPELQKAVIEEFLNDIKRLQAENERLKEQLSGKTFFCENCEKLARENEHLYEEKNCLHKIIDRLLENSGYSKDIASAEDFEDVYEDMQFKRNELEEYRKALEEIRNHCDNYARTEDYVICETFNEFLELISNKISEALK